MAHQQSILVVNFRKNEINALCSYAPLICQ